MPSQQKRDHSEPQSLIRHQLSATIPFHHWTCPTGLALGKCPVCSCYQLHNELIKNSPKLLMANATATATATATTTTSTTATHRYVRTYELHAVDYHRVFYRAGRQRYSMYLFDGNREQAICVYRRHLRLQTSKYFTLSRSCRPTISGTGPCCGRRWLGSEMVMQRSIREECQHQA